MDCDEDGHRLRWIAEFALWVCASWLRVFTAELITSACRHNIVPREAVVSWWLPFLALPLAPETATVRAAGGPGSGWDPACIWALESPTVSSVGFLSNMEQADAAAITLLLAIPQSRWAGEPLKHPSINNMNSSLPPFVCMSKSVTISQQVVHVPAHWLRRDARKIGVAWGGRMERLGSGGRPPCFTVHAPPHPLSGDPRLASSSRPLEGKSGARAQGWVLEDCATQRPRAQPARCDLARRRGPLPTTSPRAPLPSLPFVWHFALLPSA